MKHTQWDYGDEKGVRKRSQGIGHKRGGIPQGQSSAQRCR